MGFASTSPYIFMAFCLSLGITFIIKPTIIVSYSNHLLFFTIEPKETAADISSSGISAGVTIEECNFGGRSKRASSCHAALTCCMTYFVTA
jgi:hypothetical protein